MKSLMGGFLVFCSAFNTTWVSKLLFMSDDDSDTATAEWHEAFIAFYGPWFRTLHRGR